MRKFIVVVALVAVAAAGYGLLARDTKREIWDDVHHRM